MYRRKKEIPQQNCGISSFTGCRLSAFDQVFECLADLECRDLAFRN